MSKWNRTLIFGETIVFFGTKPFLIFQQCILDYIKLSKYFNVPLSKMLKI